MIAVLVLAAFTVTPLAPRTPTATPSAIEPGCANPKLPLAIVSGGPGAGRGTLPVIAVRAPRATLRLALVRTSADAELGLMCVRRLAPHAGMLFVFPADDVRQFWMKKTLLSLDMLFVGSDGIVRSVAERVPASTQATPDDRIARRDGAGRYVIELAAGAARAAGIVRGTHLDLPHVSSTAR